MGQDERPPGGGGDAGGAGPGTRRRLLLAAVPLALVAAVFALAEGTARSVGPRLDPLQVFVRSPEDRRNLADRGQARVFEWDPLLYWRLRPDLDRVTWDYTLFSTSAQGLRHDGPVGPRPAAGFRIVCLGDSVTFGYRVPVSWPGREAEIDGTALPFPMLLERWLRAANPGRPVDVVALAVPGYSSHQGLAWLRRDIDALAPDVVTILFGWNDVSERAEPDRVAMPMDPLRVTARRLASRSQLLLRACARLAGRRGGGGRGPGPSPRVAREDYVANLLAAARLARAHGAAAVLVAPVYRHHGAPSGYETELGEYRRALARAAAGAEIPFLEIEELTAGDHPAGDVLFGEDIHPSALGHRLIAERLLALLAEQGLLGGLGLPPWPPP